MSNRIEVKDDHIMIDGKIRVDADLDAVLKDIKVRVDILTAIDTSDESGTDSTFRDFVAGYLELRTILSVFDRSFMFALREMAFENAQEIVQQVNDGTLPEGISEEVVTSAQHLVTQAATLPTDEDSPDAETNRSLS